MANPSDYADFLGYKSSWPLVGGSRAEVEVSGTYNASATTITMDAGEHDWIPDPATYGDVRCLWYDKGTYGANPWDDANAEYVDCTATDFGANTVTVTRGVGGTSASTKSTAATTYVFLMVPSEEHFAVIAHSTLPNPIKYGAKGDKTTDDTQAFQDMYDDMDGTNGDACFICPAPDGYYNIAGTISVSGKAFITTFGAGIRSSIQKTGTGNLFALGNGATGTTNWYFRNVTVGAIAGAGDWLFNLNEVPRTTFSGCDLSTKSTTGGAINFLESWESTVHDTRIGSIDGVGIDIDATSNQVTISQSHIAGTTVVAGSIGIETQATGCQVVNCTIQAIEKGITYKGGRAMGVMNCYFEDVKTSINNPSTIVRGLNVAGCQFATAATGSTGHIRLANVDGLSVSGCVFQGTHSDSNGHIRLYEGDSPGGLGAITNGYIGNNSDESSAGLFHVESPATITTGGDSLQLVDNGKYCFGTEDTANMSIGDIKIAGIVHWGTTTSGGAVTDTADLFATCKVGATTYKIPLHL